MLHLAVAAADDDGRNRPVAVLVAVAHVRSVHEDRVIQHRAVAVFRRRHLLQEFGEALHVPGLDLRNLGNSLRLVGMVGNGMERIGHPNVVVGLVRAFSHHEVRGDTGNVRLVRDRDQIEHEINLFVELVVHADGTFGNLHAGDIRGRDDLRASFDFAHALQILIHPCTIAGPQLRLERLRARQNHDRGGYRTRVRSGPAPSASLTRTAR